MGSSLTVLGADVLQAFAARHAPARKSIQRWLAVVAGAQWSTFADVRSTFSSADLVAPYIVFNVGGNKYRIVTVIKFTLRIVQVEHAFTHEQYNGWKPKL